MTEPEDRARRPTGVSRRLLTALLTGLVVLVLAGTLAACGSSGGASRPATRAGATIAGGCAAGSAPVGAADVLTRADLDGDGRADTLSLTGAGRCANTLVAKVGHRYGSLALHHVRLVPGSVTLVQVPGRPGLLVSARESHPRGGFQVHLYAYAAGRLGELLDRDGNPVVPFVATDSGPTPVSSSCGRRTLVVEEAVPHRTAGAAFRWDVRRTSYVVSGARAVDQHTTQVARGIAQRQLARRYPDLVHHVLFRSCAAAAPLAASG